MTSSDRSPALHPVPVTLEGSAVLHQTLRLRWSEIRALSTADRAKVIEQATALLAPAEVEGKSAAFSLIGHKGDLLLIHFRESFDQLKQIELSLQHNPL